MSGRASAPAEQAAPPRGIEDTLRGLLVGRAPQGGGLLSVDQLAEIVLVFNLDDQLPVSMHVEQTSNFAFGSQGGGETRVVIDATFSPV